MVNNFDVNNPQHPALQDDKAVIEIKDLQQAEWLKEQIESPAQSNPKLKDALRKSQTETADRSLKKD